MKTTQLTIRLIVERLPSTAKVDALIVKRFELRKVFPCNTTSMRPKAHVCVYTRTLLETVWVNCATLSLRNIITTTIRKEKCALAHSTSRGSQTQKSRTIMFATSLYTHILEFGVTVLIVLIIPVSARRPTAVYAWETKVMNALAKTRCLESSALLTALV